ncbi:ROK family transcriptional regulator [Sphingomonas sp. PP-CE-1G-424]|uniref:ROK family transcriptional regulator n=1 Tax=Sphingomonas sp. PP-CE-1G-424 TaxID=2135658 RepID=UPI001054F642|nr:ROK family transcriptional regulator [Sphingomonas sp. PP-CE-1G-424]TCP65634.1 putative NBD/HSP70 family sugar kinase [Sphingomonas sp. PP-CE-1G-424]
MATKEYRLTQRARRVLALVRRQGRMSRSDLIRDTGLSGTAVFRATEELEAAGLLRSGETIAQGRGQPSTMMHIVADAAFSLGLSVMTDRADVVLLDLAGEVRARRDVSAPGVTRAAILGAVAAFVAEQPNRDRIVGIGLAVAGFFTAPSIINPSAELDDWALIDLAETVGRSLGMPAMVENLANAAAIGERLLGAGVDYASFCYVNVAAGLGAGLVDGGQLIRGRHGNAGEIAGMFHFANLTTPNLADLQGTLARHGVVCNGIADLVTRFELTWPGVDAWLAERQSSFAWLFQMLRYTLDCEVIVLGGRLPRPLAQRIVDDMVWPEFSLPARREVRAPSTLLIVAALDPELSASLGAASLVLHRTMFD